MSNAVSAREAAMSVLDDYQPTPTSLIAYQSHGRVAVIGDAAALALCRQWAEDIQMTLIATVDESMPASSNGAIQVHPRQIDVQGHLGGFVITLTDKQGVARSIEADILLDLNPEPVNKMQVLPPGYLHVEINGENLHEVETRVGELVGEFDKPKYFNYDASICAHGVNGKAVCMNCIEACPAGAIQSLVDRIEVDPYLCQGGGTCATVCPSGAIQYAYPRLADSGNQIRKMLEAYRQNDGQDAIVAFHAEQQFPQTQYNLSGNILPFQVEELASVGADLCLSAIVYGASQIILLYNDDIPALSLRILKRELKWIQALLGGLGLEPEAIRLQSIDDALDITEAAKLQVEPAIYSMPDGKRQAIHQAVDHLFRQGDGKRELIYLPEAAPFGTADIEKTRCTLCLACVSACPGKALQDGSNREIPGVFFIESNCLQCGTCMQTCPEDAITITPRMVFDRERRNTSRMLNQDEPFACIGCGKPFAPTSVINKMQDRLKDHHMFGSDRALDRLKMCEDCRVADIVQDPEAMNGNFGPFN